MQYLLEPYEDARVDDAVAAYRHDYGKNGLFGSSLYPGVAEAIHAMHDAGARLYLATSKRVVFARQRNNLFRRSAEVGRQMARRRFGEPVLVGKLFTIVVRETLAAIKNIVAGRRLRRGHAQS